MRNFAGISFLEKQAQDAPGLLKFLHLLDDHHPGEAVFSGIQERFRRAGFMMRAALARMPVMTHSMLSPRDKKGKCARKSTGQWYHGEKVRAGADTETGYVHTLAATAANVHTADLWEDG